MAVLAFGDKTLEELAVLHLFSFSNLSALS